MLIGSWSDPRWGLSPSPRSPLALFGGLGWYLQLQLSKGWDRERRLLTLSWRSQVIPSTCTQQAAFCPPSEPKLVF